MSLPPVSPGDLAVQAAKTVIVFAVIGTALRLLGKREASQLNVYDLAMLMALANAVQNAMTAGRGNLAIGLVTSATVVLTAWALSRLMVRSPAAERLITGSPSLLVYNGHLMADRLRRQRLTVEDLDAALRAYGLTDLSQVRTAVLEVDGSISMIPKGLGDGSGER
ncbi:MAG TPA: YetF domain-containing protein [Actinomycetota bacterium]|nr:YetF domain-containing protein [Actinomycetota bacterium]